MIGLDTSTIIDIFKGLNSAQAALEGVTEPICATELSYTELMFGINPESKSHEMEEKFYDEFFDSIISLNLTKPASKKSSRIFWGLQKEGKTIEQFDCMIAAILLVNGVDKIITRNKKHFEGIKGLKVISY